MFLTADRGGTEDNLPATERKGPRWDDFPKNGPPDRENGCLARAGDRPKPGGGQKNDRDVPDTY